MRRRTRGRGMRGLRRSRGCGRSGRNTSGSFRERSRSAASSQADGGWVGDGDRRLTPEQNTDASKACEDIRTEGKEVIRPAMERVEAADPGRRLAGLEHMLKGEDRLKEKIADEITCETPSVRPCTKPLDTVPDAVRFTLHLQPATLR